MVIQLLKVNHLEKEKLGKSPTNEQRQVLRSGWG